MSKTVYSRECVLVPKEYFAREKACEYLLDFFPGVNTAKIQTIASADKVLVYVAENKEDVHELYNLLEASKNIKEYNKVVASYWEGILYLSISQGDTLLLCNTYSAVDFSSAEYFIFLAMQKLQLNPALTTIFFRTNLSLDEKISLSTYFKRVEEL